MSTTPPRSGLRRAGAVLIAVGTTLASACSAASNDDSDYPQRDIQVVVPYPAGSGIDTTTRALTDIINDQGDLGRRMQVVNREGGAGSVGTTAVLNAKPDGYTIGVVPDGPLTLLPQTEDLSYDPENISVINEIITSPIMIVVPEESPHEDLQSLVAAAGDDPSTITLAEGPLNYTVPADKLEQESDVTFKRVKFDGDQATTTALLGGNVDAGVMQLASALPQLQAGKIRALALTSAEPVDLVPDVPTFADAGVDFAWEAYNVVVAPDGLPDEVRDTLENAFAQAVQSPEFADAAEKLGLIVSGAGSEEAMANLQEKTESSAAILGAEQ
ncbi:Bug family tripartite tricarboxylate transporter substrate binding protein [Aeromicrobium sp. CTD01-1L150]|uniref:Bug family tripartite tricarboxylate transporter substrate binding protein n=1 Tax=Aeromicrobium sp. CTD01-1L150 TaxID=3341830 RepID=UPI0035C0604B